MWETERKRDFKGEPYGTWVAQGLNEMAPRPLARILRIIELLRAAESLREAARGYKKTLEIFIRLSELLPKGPQYRFEPALSSNLDGTRIEFDVWGKKGASLMLPLIVKLTEMGLIAHIRRCERCGKFYFSHFRSQRFCSYKCKKAHQRDNPEYKKRHLAIAKKSYKNSKDAKYKQSLRRAL